MGLTAVLSNALSGMNVNQRALDVVSRNVANAGTPGYNKQSLNVVDYTATNSSYVRDVGVERAFNSSLQAYYNRQISDAASADVQASYMDRLQVYLGKPGSAGSLDTVFNSFSNSLQALATSPEDYSVRAKALSDAQGLVETLNRLTTTVQGLRKETEGQISTRVSDLNNMLKSLEDVNKRLLDHGTDDTSRAALMDQRDRLVSGIGEIVDIKADYRSDGTVALMTRSGVGLIDRTASVFSFQPAGGISASSQFSTNPALNGVGTLTMTTPGGLTIDLVQQNALQSGELAGLIKLRDETLVTAQSQLDQIAAGLAQAMSTVQTQGAAVPGGLEVDLAAVQPGNDFLLRYTENGTPKTVKVVRVDDATKLPMDYADASGTRVIGLDFSGGIGNVAASLQTALGSGLTVTNPAGATLRVVDDGAGNTTDVTGLVSRSTTTANQGGGLALSLFVDSGNAAFTNSLDGLNEQRLGFAGRISINSAVLSDNRLLVQSTAGGSLGDASRPRLLIDQLGSMTFTAGSGSTFQLSGNVSQLISQTIDFQGSTVSNALQTRDNQKLTLETLTGQMDTEYGVSIDEEMARLMELQNAYAANARVVSIVKELLDTLMNI